MPWLVVNAWPHAPITARGQGDASTLFNLGGYGID